MCNFDPDQILPLVEKPSRYIGGEINSIRKDTGAVALRMALAFPDTYEIGTSHFGMQILYRLLNDRPDIAAERVFAPGLDLAEQLKASGVSLFSLETRRPLSRFDIIGFSLLYELNYTNVLMMLDLAGIPFYARHRDADQPLVIAGGPCTVNPEPVAPFFDAMVVGDGEPVILEMGEAWMKWKAEGGRDKDALLNAWAGIPGVYIPAFFRMQHDAQGYCFAEPLRPGYTRVQRRVVPDLDAAPFPEQPVVPFGRPVHDRLRLEIARGCTRGCRFCQAGTIYRPVRERGLGRLAALAEKGLRATGYEELSLLSLSTGDYSCLLPLMRHLSDRYAADRLAVSIPSFRAGTLSPEMMELIRSVRKTGFTIAPEAGSERLRAVINKNISEAEIFDTMESAFALGWQLIKLYFMIGLPSETDADIDEIAELVRRLRKSRPRAKRGGNINVSVAAFIPKPHVPFQWAGQLDAAESLERMTRLRDRLSIKGVAFKWQNPETSRLEGIFARGDRRLAPVLKAAWERGCCFDGWSDLFDNDAWSAAFLDAGLDPAPYLAPIPFSARLPWDHIDIGLTRDFLEREYHRALDAQTTPDCCFGDCQGCGVCDFENLSPVTADQKADAEDVGSAPPDRLRPDLPGTRLRAIYTKLGPARFFGHLELANILIRALRRAGVRLVYSGGFHPKPKIAFGDALPVGMESMCETFFMTVADPAGNEAIRDAVNRELPEGLAVTECVPVPAKAAAPAETIVSYRIVATGGVRFDGNALRRFAASETFEVRVPAKKGEKQIDLKTVVAEIVCERPDCLYMCLLRQPGASIRPGRVVQAVFGHDDAAVERARICKLAEQAAPGPGSGNQCNMPRGLHG